MTEPVKINVMVSGEVTQQELANALIYHAIKRYLEPNFDDCGLDLYTDTLTIKVFLGKNPDAIIAYNSHFAVIVDAYNILVYGKTLKISHSDFNKST